MDKKFHYGRLGSRIWGYELDIFIRAPLLSSGLNAYYKAMTDILSSLKHKIVIKKIKAKDTKMTKITCGAFKGGTEHREPTQIKCPFAVSK